jgi:integrin-linked kinase
VIDSGRALQFAIDVAKGMAFLHSLERKMPRLYLNSKHVMVIITRFLGPSEPEFHVHLSLQIDCQAHDELVARINMADARFSFQDRGKMHHPQWMAPEALMKSQNQVRLSDIDLSSTQSRLYLKYVLYRNYTFPDQCASRRYVEFCDPPLGVGYQRSPIR